MADNPLHATIAAAPAILHDPLTQLAQRIAAAIVLFGQHCDARSVAIEVQLSHGLGVGLAALAFVDRETRSDFTHLSPFKPEAFAQRAMAAALDVEDDARAVAPASIGSLQ